MGGGQVLRHAYPDGDELVASAAAAEEGDALAAHTEHRARLRPLGDGELHLAVERGHLDLGAEDGLRVAYLLLEQDGGTVALKAGVRAHADGHEQVALRAAVRAGVAVAGAGDGLPVVDTGGDVHRHLVLAADAAHAAAGLAGLMYYLAGASALGAGRRGLREAEGRALGGANRARALAVGADLRRRAGGTAVALAVGALLYAADGHLFFTAEGGLLEAYVQRRAHALAAAGAVGIAPRAAAEAEYVSEAAENVAQIAEITEAAEARAAVEAGVRVEGRVAELVVLFALFLVGEHLVGLVRLLEALLAGLVVRVQVGVSGFGDIPVCFFYFIRRGALVNAEHLVIITFVCHIVLQSKPGIRTIEAGMQSSPQ